MIVATAYGTLVNELININIRPFSNYRSTDGNFLVVSSTDGYCSIMNFKYGELGSIYVQKEEVGKTFSKTNLPGTCSDQSEENSEATADETISDGENYGPDTEPMDVSFSQGNDEKGAVVENGKHSTIEEDIQVKHQAGVRCELFLL